MLGRTDLWLTRAAGLVLLALLVAWPGPPVLDDRPGPGAALADDDDPDDDGPDDDGSDDSGPSAGGGSSGGGASSGGGSSGGGASSGGGSGGGGAPSGGGSGAATGGSSGGGPSTAGGSTGGSSSSTGGGTPTGGVSGGGSVGSSAGGTGGSGTAGAGAGSHGDGGGASAGGGGRGGGAARGDPSADREDRPTLAGSGALGWLLERLRGITSAGGGDRFRPGEILAIDLSAEARARLLRAGFTAGERRRLATLGVTVTRLGPPPGRTLTEALELARAADPATVFDLNHLYDRLSCAGCWVEAAASLRLEPRACRGGLRIGLLDTAVDRGHPTLTRARIVSRRMVPAETPEADPGHGTAIASLLVGAPPAMGLLPGAELRVAAIFARGGPAGAEADALALAAGLDWLVGDRVPVVNASLAGPANRLIELAVYLAGRRGTVIVAAAGNGGPGAPPAFPAAYDGVVAVTAVDAALRPWRAANRGSYVAFAAPGVDLPTALPGGGLGPASGTSFAAPFVAAALAQAAGPRGDVRRGLARLAGAARDLGSPGRDPVFGHGLVQAVGCRS